MKQLIEKCFNYLLFINSSLFRLTAINQGPTEPLFINCSQKCVVLIAKCQIKSKYALLSVYIGKWGVVSLVNIRYAVISRNISTSVNLTGALFVIGIRRINMRS